MIHFNSKDFYYTGLSYTKDVYGFDNLLPNSEVNKVANTLRVSYPIIIYHGEFYLDKSRNDRDEEKYIPISEVGITPANIWGTIREYCAGKASF